MSKLFKKSIISQFLCLLYFIFSFQFFFGVAFTFLNDILSVAINMGGKFNVSLSLLCMHIIKYNIVLHHLHVGTLYLKQKSLFIFMLPKPR